MILPPPLQPGDAVGMVAPSRLIKPDQVEQALATFNLWGLEVRQGSSLFGTHGYFAGTDENRLNDLQNFINDPEIRCIFCARGGYGVTRILDQLNLKPLLETPKWIVGFSDITALHLALGNLEISSIHGLMPVQFGYFGAESSIESLRKLLFDRVGEVIAPYHSMNRLGKVNAPVVGGNLSLIVDSIGTKNEIQTRGKILFLEEIDEYLYKIDRMLIQLKRAGKLDLLAGLMIGDFTQTKDTQIPFGQNLEQIILAKVSQYDYPLAFSFPVGHEIPNHSILMMKEITLQVEYGHSRIFFSF
ncbi:MAG: LD-carboxypeptidase [Bacteroidota bacterium]